MVLLSVMLEFRQIDIIERIKSGAPTIVAGSLGITMHSVPAERRNFHRFVVGMIVTGTLIWGYGDVPFGCKF